MAVAVDWVGVSEDLWNIVYLAVAIWAGFVVTAFVTNNLFEGRKWSLALVFLGNQLVTLLAMALIVGLWV